MLSDEQLEIISDAIIPLFQYLEKEVIADIARRIAKTLTYSRTAELQAVSMAKLGYSPAKIRKEAMKMLNADPNYRKVVAKNTLEYKREVRDIINGITKSAYLANDTIMADAGNMSWINDLSVWKSAGKELTDNSYLKQLVDVFSKQTAGDFKNMTQSTGFKVMSGYEGMQNAYRRELDKAVIKICSGTFSQEKVIRDVVHDLAQSGLRSIDYASGYSMQLDTAVRLAVRTGCHQLAGKIMDENIKQTGENLVYVSQHPGARNTGVGHANHEQWQGKVYFIKDGTDYSQEAHRIGQDRIMSLWYATGYSVDGTQESDPTGLYGYNCRHSHFAWFEGISSLPKEDKREPVTIDGKTYDYYAMTQKMRYMERNIRALKREKEAIKSLPEELGLDTQEIDARIKRKTAEYKEFCQICGVPEKTSRLRYECGTSDLKKTKAWNRFDASVLPAKKLIADAQQSATMDISEDKGNTEVHTVGKIDRKIYRCITNDIRTDEVIITDERIEHIRERRGEEFYNKYRDLFGEILRQPDYIFKEKREHTALVCKRIVEDEKYVNLVLRIAIEEDNPEYKNSIITAIGESEKRFAQRLRNNTALYKKE